MIRPYKLSASIICSTFSDINNDLQLLEKAKIDSIHFDVMDGVFVPRLGLFPEYLRMIKDHFTLPLHVHMMVIHPELFIESFVKAGADTISIHAELPTATQCIQLIKKCGLKAGIALNPETNIEVIESHLSEIDHIVLMGIHPGILGQKLIPSTYTKIAKLRKCITDFPNVTLEVDGGVTPETAPKLLQAGADMLVCGTGTIFQQKAGLYEKISELKTHINTILSA
jgi:ribulose-phosphate 3-epimerase